jgi:oligopeptide/dipeptide ABC transporter ATP-binding protein
MSVTPLATAVTPLAEARGLEVELRRRGRTVRALDGVDLEWRRNEVLGVVGESGSGKTTLARTLLGLEQPTGGELRFEGARLDRGGVRTMRQKLQMVFQDPYGSLDPRMPVGELVQEPLRMHGGPRAERILRAASALEDVGLAPAERFWNRYPRELSGGQCQRVAIASALARDPAGLVCDEPVSALDVSMRAQVLHLLLSLRRARGLSLLLITHDIGTAWALCDRVAVMYLGRIVELGSAADVLERPQHPYTQGLVAVTPSTRPRPAYSSAALLQGEAPDASQIPSGCRFHPRCPRARERCAVEDVSLRPSGASGQTAACWYPGAEALPPASIA